MARYGKILAIETSCDDTSVAVVDDSGFVLACCSANQDLAHAPYGGVVPEIASRSHTETLLPLGETTRKKAGVAWNQLRGIAVTSRPGLMGSLMVGVVTAKTLALVKGLPWIGVNHIEGHLVAPLLAGVRRAAAAASTTTGISICSPARSTEPLRSMISAVQAWYRTASSLGVSPGRTV